MRQVTEIKQEPRQSKSTVTVTLHGRKGESAGLEPFFGLEDVQSALHRGVLLDANAFFLHPSLSRNLTVKTAITESRSRYRRTSLPLPKSFLSEAHLASSDRLVLEADPTKTGPMGPKT